MSVNDVQCIIKLDCIVCLAVFYRRHVAAWHWIIRCINTVRGWSHIHF